MNRKIDKMNTVPTKPSSSPIIAKIKSVCGVGRNKFLPKLLPKPKPKKPPLPRLIKDCFI